MPGLRRPGFFCPFMFGMVVGCAEGQMEPRERGSAVHSQCLDAVSLGSILNERVEEGALSQKATLATAAAPTDLWPLYRAS